MLRQLSIVRCDVSGSLQLPPKPHTPRPARKYASGDTSVVRGTSQYPVQVLHSAADLETHAPSEQLRADSGAPETLNLDFEETRTLPNTTEALSGKLLRLIFWSTTSPAKSSGPLAIAPTNTARGFDFAVFTNVWGCMTRASADSARGYPVNRCEATPAGNRCTHLSSSYFSEGSA